jgi:hypothetical protein
LPLHILLFLLLYIIKTVEPSWLSRILATYRKCRYHDARLRIVYRIVVIKEEPIAKVVLEGSVRSLYDSRQTHRQRHRQRHRQLIHVIRHELRQRNGGARLITHLTAAASLNFTAPPRSDFFEAAVVPRRDCESRFRFYSVVGKLRA